MKEKTITCIGCSNACVLSVQYEIDEKSTEESWKGNEFISDDAKVEVSGYSCPRGKAYGLECVTKESRILEEYIPVLKTEKKVYICTAQAVKKEDFKKVLLKMRALEVKEPLKDGMTICQDIAGTGIPVIIKCVLI